MKANDKLKEYVNFEKFSEYMEVGGIRIEDCVLVTKTGYEMLTECPRTVEEIENCMAGKEWKKESI